MLTALLKQKGANVCPVIILLIAESSNVVSEEPATIGFTAKSDPI